MLFFVITLAGAVSVGYSLILIMDLIESRQDVKGISVKKVRSKTNRSESFQAPVGTKKKTAVGRDSKGRFKSEKG
jgi:hypothetical protein